MECKKVDGEKEKRRDGYIHRWTDRLKEIMIIKRKVEEEREREGLEAV